MLVGTEYQFLLLPKRCHITNQILWFTYAYVETHMFTGPGDSIFEYKYYDKQQYLVNKIKGTI